MIRKYAGAMKFPGLASWTLSTVYLFFAHPKLFTILVLYVFVFRRMFAVLLSVDITSNHSRLRAFLRLPPSILTSKTLVKLRLCNDFFFFKPGFVLSFNFSLLFFLPFLSGAKLPANWGKLLVLNLIKESPILNITRKPSFFSFNITISNLNLLELVVGESGWWFLSIILSSMPKLKAFVLEKMRMRWTFERNGTYCFLMFVFLVIRVGFDILGGINRSVCHVVYGYMWSKLKFRDMKKRKMNWSQSSTCWRTVKFWKGWSSDARKVLPQKIFAKHYWCLKEAQWLVKFNSFESFLSRSLVKLCQ